MGSVFFCRGVCGRSWQPPHTIDRNHSLLASGPSVDMALTWVASCDGTLTRLNTSRLAVAVCTGAGAGVSSQSWLRLRLSIEVLKRTLKVYRRFPAKICHLRCDVGQEWNPKERLAHIADSPPPFKDGRFALSWPRELVRVINNRQWLHLNWAARRSRVQTAWETGTKSKKGSHRFKDRNTSTYSGLSQCKVAKPLLEMRDGNYLPQRLQLPRLCSKHVLNLPTHLKLSLYYSLNDRYRCGSSLKEVSLFTWRITQIATRKQWVEGIHKNTFAGVNPYFITVMQGDVAIPCRVSLFLQA